MGYASYTLPDGREAGYAIETTCDEPGCDTRINRGLAYLCGHEPADGLGCGDYFCGEHLYLGAPWPGGQWCRACLETERCVACGSDEIAVRGTSTYHRVTYAACPDHADEGYEHAMAEHHPCDCATERP